MAQGAVAARRPTVVRRTIAAALVTLVTLTGALAGCGKPAPGPTPTSASSAPSPTATETSPTASPTPSPTPPAKPAAWTTNDDTGALAAAQYFMDLYNYVIATGDLTEWQALADPACEFCTNVATNVSDLYGAGGHFEGGATSVTSAAFDSFDEGLGLHAVRLEVTTSEMRRLTSTGALERTTAGGDFRALVDLGFSPSGWLLVGLTVTSESS